MKRYKPIRRAVAAAAFAVLVAALAAGAQDLPKIAVYVTGDVGDGEKKALGTRILSALVNSGRYTGIERSSSFLAEIEKEQEKQRSGAIDDGQISELGRQFGVKFVCIADITPVLGEFQISARVVDVETAVVVLIGEAFSPMKTTSDLAFVSGKVVDNMFGGKTAPEAPPPQSPPEPAQPTQASRQAETPSPPTRNSTAQSYPTPNYDKEYALGGPSVGGGLILANDGGGGVYGVKDNDDWRYTVPWTGIGFHVFLDVTYAEFALNYAFCFGSPKLGFGDDLKEDKFSTVSFSTVGIGALGKYPVALGEQLSFFPAVGIEYVAVLSGKWVSTEDGYENVYEWDGKNGRDKAGDFSALWFKFGAGFDFALGGKRFLRTEALYGFRLSSKYENNAVKGNNIGVSSSDGDYETPALGHGWTIKAGIGTGF